MSAHYWFDPKKVVCTECCNTEFRGVIGFSCAGFQHGVEGKLLCDVCKIKTNDDLKFIGFVNNK